MDKNSVIGLVLIGVILVTFSIFNAPSEEELAEIKRKKDSIEQVDHSQDSVRYAMEKKADAMLNEAADSAVIETIEPAVKDSAANAQNLSIYGMFAGAANGENDHYVIENELIKATISRKGGRIATVELKKYHTYDSTALYLFEEEHSRFNLNYFTRDQRLIPTEELYFEPNGQPFEVNGEDEKSFSMRLYDQSRNSYLEYIYSLKGDSYMLDVAIRMVGFDKVMDRNADALLLNWKIDSPSQEKTVENQQRSTTTYYKYKDGDVDYISETSDDKEKLVGPIKWVAFKQQYFTAAIIAEDQFENDDAEVETKTIENTPDYVKTLTTNLSIPFEHLSDQQFELSFYFGPLHFQTLEELGLEMESLIPLGWGIFGWVNEWVVIKIFNWLDHFNLSYGIIILLLTIIIKLALFPITYKTYLSSAKMKVLKPEIAEINEKHKDDAMKKQQAVMALYKKTGVNPFSGCIPMLIQFPILLAMFKFFPASIELRQQSFLWADDLSTYDSIMELPFEIPFYGSHVSLFTLLMAISMIFYTRMNSSMSMGAGGAGGEMQATQMKIMMYLMPVMMLFFFNSYSAGLSYYYLVANVMSIGQQFAIKNWIVNEEAIHKQIEANKKKPMKKKSSFQKRLEDMAKQKGYQAPKKK